LDVSAFTDVCIKDAPYIKIVFGNQPQYNGKTATITLHQGANVIETHTATYQANETLTFIWPGATAAPDGSGLTWPGWITNPDGTYSPDPSTQFLRDPMQVTVEVNPEATGTVTYPPATSACANPPTTTGTPDTTPAPPTSAPDTPPTTGLPVTGGEQTRELWAALCALSLGALIILAVRRQPATV
jgi:hypothetical protein